MKDQSWLVSISVSNCMTLTLGQTWMVTIWSEHLTVSCWTSTSKPAQFRHHTNSRGTFNQAANSLHMPKNVFFSRSLSLEPGAGIIRYWVSFQGVNKPFMRFPFLNEYRKIPKSAWRRRWWSSWPFWTICQPEKVPSPPNIEANQSSSQPALQNQQYSSSQTTYHHPQSDGQYSKQRFQLLVLEWPRFRRCKNALTWAAFKSQTMRPSFCSKDKIDQFFNWSVLERNMLVGLL